MSINEGYRGFVKTSLVGLRCSPDSDHIYIDSLTVRLDSKIKGKGMFLYNSAVSSPLDRSKRFTLFCPPHSDTNSASPGSILAIS